MPRRIRDHRLERSCRTRLAQLGLPPQIRPSDLIARLEERRGRELWVVSKPLPVEITGIWVGTPDRDYVHPSASLDGCHRVLAVLHEFSHMICEHQSAEVGDLRLRERCPWIDGLGVVEHVCMRSDHDTADEREAEVMAALILAGLAERPGQRPPHTAQGELALARRAEAIFCT